MPQLQISRFLKLFHFLVRRVLAAAPAKLLQLQPLRLGFPVLGGRVIPLFAITALQRNDLSGHRSLLNFLALRGRAAGPRPQDSSTTE
jgi:hypothetical protein